VEIRVIETGGLDGHEHLARRRDRIGEIADDGSGTVGYSGQDGAHGGILLQKTLITPALFSQPSPSPPGRRGRRPSNKKKRILKLPSLPGPGGWRAGREGLGE
jgi:hypothetical protein